jgi:hypothetical protein
VDALTRRHWLVTALLFGLFYVAVGLVSSELSAAASSRQLGFVWRFGAYVVSAIAFAIHLRYEYFTARSAPATAALHAATGVALGALFLATAALIRAQIVGGPNPVGHVIALVAWPAITAIPAFIVGLAATALLARSEPRD